MARALLFGRFHKMTFVPAALSLFRKATAQSRLPTV